MRIFLEAIEAKQSGTEDEGDFIRIDITDGDLQEALKDLRKILDPHKQYVIQKHYCGHDEGKACTVEIIQ